MFDFHLGADFGPAFMNACGILGAVLYVGGFALVQLERICGNGNAYAVSKIIAACLVLVSLAGAFNLGAFIIQIGFIGFGLWGLWRRLEEEEADPPRSQVGHLGFNRYYNTKDDSCS